LDKDIRENKNISIPYSWPPLTSPPGTKRERIGLLSGGTTKKKEREKEITTEIAASLKRVDPVILFYEENPTFSSKKTGFPRHSSGERGRNKKRGRRMKRTKMAELRRRNEGVKEGYIRHRSIPGARE